MKQKTCPEDVKGGHMTEGKYLRRQAGTKEQGRGGRVHIKVLRQETVLFAELKESSVGVIRTDTFSSLPSRQIGLHFLVPLWLDLF